jgi:two-component system chemotaxis response regulator CheB
MRRPLVTVTGPVRLLIVDDSLVTRNLLERLAASDPGITVVGKAENGAQGLEQARRLRPDVITLDIEMPVMNGLDALRAIMKECPTRVLMLSSLTTAGAQATLEALALGAVDFIAKPGTGPLELQRLRDTLVARIRAVAGAPRRPPPPPPPAPLPARRRSGQRRRDVILIGTSTGGPAALQTLIPALPGDLPVGVLVVQHMPAGFTAQLAQRLNRLSAVTVREAVDGDRIEPGTVLIAPGHSHLLARDMTHVALAQEPADLPHRPAVDVLLLSAAPVFRQGALGVILTGMGSDGRAGMAAVKAHGGGVMAQDQASCVVYGMPKAVIDAGLADQVCPLEQLAAAVVQAVG